MMKQPSVSKKNNQTFLDRGALDSLAEELEGESRRAASADGEFSVSADPDSTSTDDEASSSSGHLTGGSTHDFEAELRRKILREEERNVRRARILVGIAFVTCAAAITCAVYFFTKQSDQYAFENEYEGYVKDIKALVRWEVRYNFALMEQLSASVTIAAHLKGSTFPNHTEPQFEITGGFVDGMGGIMSGGFAPIITSEEREQWEEYSVANQNWVETSVYLKMVHPGHRDALHGTIQDHEHDRLLRRELVADKPASASNISKEIYKWENNARVAEYHEPDKVYAPLWQVSPADYSAINVNLLSDPIIKETYDVMVKTNQAILSRTVEIDNLYDFLFDEDEKDQKKAPHAFILVPVYEEFVETDKKVVGFVIGVTVMGNLLDRLLPEGTEGIIAVFKSECDNSTLSYELSSGKAFFLGYGDFHEEEFNAFEAVEPNLEMYQYEVEGICTHDLYLYPSASLRETFDTSRPVTYASVVAIAFVVTAVLLAVYDLMVNRRQIKVMKAASRTQAIVTSLFPKDIGRKLVEEAYSEGKNTQSDVWKKQGGASLQTILGHNGQLNGDSTVSSKKPLADFFPECTVMFADLVGFTAWSSTREPTQVFVLLESLYSAYDKLAVSRKVFKVETVGDCYVAVCGVPEERKDHAITMVRFARDCLNAMYTTLNQLTIELGPDTNELGMRIGLNSGPVTAGVLRGDRARFQLFGDTVNTAARLETNGGMNRIHVSEATANLLVEAGKPHWLTPRATQIHAKGKGLMKTFWVHTKDDAGTRSTAVASSTDESSAIPESVDHKNSVGRLPSVASRNSRVLDWTVEILQSFLKEIVARRNVLAIKPDSPEKIKAMECQILSSTRIPMDEVESLFHLPLYTPDRQGTTPDNIEIAPVVLSQLRDLVFSISEMYHDNPFHNFSHASHVTLSVVKLLKRIVAPTDGTYQEAHDHTYGITSDPLTQFTVIFSALIHDVDHGGVPNAQLVSEKDELAIQYREKSIAEQNSVTLTWKLLMEDRFSDLRSVIYTTVKDLQRFRQILVHTVLATDIMDKELSQQRKERWRTTFGSEEGSTVDLDDNDDDDEIDRKATIVIEHLMQASDVAHTMQHWHVYRKWNARLFKEMYKAFQLGRSSQDPSLNWYESELGFFDFYIIPLARKLKSCGVFGVSSDEYLNYALQNRSEWESKGRDVVDSYIREVQV